MAVDADDGLGRKTVATLEVEAFLAEQGERDRDPRVDETGEHDEHACDDLQRATIREERVAELGVILGAHILARHGADLLPGPMIAMNAAGGTLEPLLATIHPHPTLSEAVKVAARDG